MSPDAAVACHTEVLAGRRGLQKGRDWARHASPESSDTGRESVYV